MSVNVFKLSKIDSSVQARNLELRTTVIKENGLPVGSWIYNLAQVLISPHNQTFAPESSAFYHYKFFGKLLSNT